VQHLLGGITLPHHVPGHTVAHRVVETDRAQQRIGGHVVAGAAGRTAGRGQMAGRGFLQLLRGRIVQLDVTYDGAGARIAYRIHGQEHTVHTNLVVDTGTFVRLTALPGTVQVPVVRQYRVEAHAPRIGTEHAFVVGTQTRL